MTYDCYRLTYQYKQNLVEGKWDIETHNMTLYRTRQDFDMIYSNLFWPNYNSRSKDVFAERLRD